MTLLNEADALAVGTSDADAVYLGADQVWPSGFDPLSIAGLAVWLKASDLALADGANVSTWPNPGSLADAAAVGGFEPKYRAAVNGGPAVEFINEGASVADVLNLPDLSALTAGMVFVVIKTRADPPGSDDSTGLWRLGTSGLNTHFPYTDSIILDGTGTTARKTVGNPATPLTQFNVYDVRTASGSWEARLNGTSLFSTATNTVGFSATPRIGQSNGTYFLDGWIKEFLIYNSALSSGDATAVRDYLKARHGTP